MIRLSVNIMPLLLSCKLDYKTDLFSKHLNAIDLTEISLKCAIFAITVIYIQKLYYHNIDSHYLYNANICIKGF